MHAQLQLTERMPPLTSHQLIVGHHCRPDVVNSLSRGLHDFDALRGPPRRRFNFVIVRHRQRKRKSAGCRSEMPRAMCKPGSDYAPGETGAVGGGGCTSSRTAAGTVLMSANRR